MARLKTYTYQDSPEGRERLRQAAEHAGVSINSLLRAVVAREATRLLHELSSQTGGKTREQAR